ncbi:MAG: ABC transporter permease [Clostridia bacterium]|nr:ABC transporter permease [Clostridia bacterium]
MFAIFKKELRAYLTTPIGYVYVGIFLAVSALICAFTTLQQASYNTSAYFQYLLFLLIVLIPILTMRMFAEERKSRTEQLLLTAPVTITGMVLGKFFAAFTLFASTVVVSCVNFLPLIGYAVSEQSISTADTHIGPIDGQIIGCLIGVLLIGAAFIAIGLFISSLTENQLASAIVTIAVLAAMVFVGIIAAYVNSPVLRTVLDWVSVLSRYDNFSMGLFDFSALLYYVSIAGVFVFLTVRIYEKRRWG